MQAIQADPRSTGAATVMCGGNMKQEAGLDVATVCASHAALPLHRSHRAMGTTVTPSFGTYSVEPLFLFSRKTY